MNLSEGVDYIFVEKPDSDGHHSTKLIGSEWAGAVFTYDSVSVIEDQKNDRAILKFTYLIEHVTDDYTKEFLESSIEFKSHIGSLLAQILESKTGHIGNAK